MIDPTILFRLASVRCASLVSAHVLSRGPEQPLQGDLGLFGLLSGKVHLAVDLAELLDKQHMKWTQTVKPKYKSCEALFVYTVESRTVVRSAQAKKR